LQHQRFCQCNAKNGDSYDNLNPNDLGHFLGIGSTAISWRR